MPWSVLPYLVVSAALAAGSLLLTRDVPWRLRTPSWRTSLPFAALVLATLPMMWRFIQLVGSPEHPSQVFDNVFHLNAIRFILDSGNASSLTLASIQGVQGLDAVYPAAWHSFAALLVQLTAVDIPTAENVLNLVIVVLLWPASCLFLVTKTISRRPAALVIAAVIAGTQVAFPFLMIVWGPLFPYAMAVSMMPVVIAELAAVVRVGRTRTEPLLSWAAALVLSLGGLAFAHTRLRQHHRGTGSSDPRHTLVASKATQGDVAAQRRRTVAIPRRDAGGACRRGGSLAKAAARSL
ncbi:hypothetical protein NG819_10870 [Pseudarthrobacter sp. Fe7]|nr:hypothetical protein NG819_10870 [Pseudarthrobacter sp. Fe7]